MRLLCSSSLVPRDVGQEYPVARVRLPGEPEAGGLLLGGGGGGHGAGVLVHDGGGGAAGVVGGAAGVGVAVVHRRLGPRAAPGGGGARGALLDLRLATTFILRSSVRISFKAILDYFPISFSIYF